MKNLEVETAVNDLFAVLIHPSNDQVDLVYYTIDPQMYSCNGHLMVIISPQVVGAASHEDIEEVIEMIRLSFYSFNVAFELQVKQYFHNIVYQALLNCIRVSLNMIKKRTCSRVGAGTVFQYRHGIRR
jgi:hypothetical protein